MQQNTVQTLYDYVKDLTGQTNLTAAKFIRAVNFGLDHLSYLKNKASNRSDWDSANHGDLNRVTTSSSSSTLSIEEELNSIKKLEINLNGYRELYPLDQRDSNYEYLQQQTGTPTHFDIDGQVIRVFPVPDTTYTYRLTFGRVHPRYSADNLTQATGLDATDEEYVALYAADRIMIGVNDPIRAQIRNELQLKQKEITESASKKDQSTAKRLRTKGTNLSRRQFNRYTNFGDDYYLNR